MSIPRYFQEYKSLKFQDYILIAIIGYVMFNRLVEQSKSQELLQQVEQRAKAAEDKSKQALQRTEAIEKVNHQITATVEDLSKLNESALNQIQAIDARYRAKKDSSYASFKNRLNETKKRLLEIQKLQKTL